MKLHVVLALGLAMGLMVPTLPNRKRRLRVNPQALVGGKVFNADYQRQWLDSLQSENPRKPLG